MPLSPERKALYDELHAAHAAVQEAKEAYTAAANRRRAAAKALDIGPTALAVELGFESVSSAHAILKAAVDGKLPPTEHKRKSTGRRARRAQSAESTVPTLHLVTGVESETTTAEADAPRTVGATF
jgi:hypothetical protein